MSDNDSISSQCLASATYNSCTSSKKINDGIITKTFITIILRATKRFVHLNRRTGLILSEGLRKGFFSEQLLLVRS
jgi:hypothetical protein